MCDVRERAFITILKYIGISVDDAILLNLEDLEGFQKTEWVHIWMFRGKEGVEYETFLGPNAVDALKAYLNLRKQKGENITLKSPVFATKRKPYKRLERRTLSTLFTRITEKTGMRISTHRLRKFFETYMALTVRHPIVLKYWMVHQIMTGRDIEARYIIPPTPEQLELYKNGYKNIDLTGESMEERVKAIEEIMEGMTPEQKELMQRHSITMREKAKKPPVKRKTETNGAGVDCQRIIDQQQLEEWLAKGWRFIAVLNGGKCIVERNNH